MEAMQIAAYEVEEHVAEHVRFFQLTNLTLDDLNVYAEPFASIIMAANRLAHGNVTEVQALDAIRLAAIDVRAIDDRLATESAA